MRCAKRAARDQRPLGREHAGDRMDAHHLECLARSSGGRIEGRRRPSIVLPVPGGPASSRLWPPAAASSSARRARSWPRTSARSGGIGLRRPRPVARRVAAEIATEVRDRLREVAHGHGLDSAQLRLAADSAAHRIRSSPERRAPSATANARARAGPVRRERARRCRVLAQAARAEAAEMPPAPPARSRGRIRNLPSADPRERG